MRSPRFLKALLVIANGSESGAVDMEAMDTACEHARQNLSLKRGARQSWTMKEKEGMAAITADEGLE